MHYGAICVSTKSCPHSRRSKRRLWLLAPISQLHSQAVDLREALVDFAHRTSMSAELNPDLRLEIAHVLFIDIVGYSKLLINEQRESLEELNQIARATSAFRTAEAADQLIRIPTGDGMALVFSTSPDAPVQCALEISKALKGRPE